MNRKWLGIALPLALLVASCGDMPTEGPGRAAPGSGLNFYVAPAGDVVVYGTEVGANMGDLWAVNLTAGTTHLMYTWTDPSGDNNSPNAVAFDAVNQRMYFSVNDSDGSPFSGTPDKLYMFDVTGSLATGSPGAEPVLVGTLPRTAYAADFYGGSYYYIPNVTADLIRVNFKADGHVDPDNPPTTVCPNFRTSGTPSGSRLFFGDIAIRNGVVYGSMNVDNDDRNVRFFTVNLNTCAYQETVRPERTMLQLAWVDGVLYGHETDTGRYFTIDPANGARLAQVTGVPTTPKLSDIAGVFTPVTPDEALVVTKTATGTFDRTYTWTLAKSASPTSLSGVLGQTAGSTTWTVTAERTVADGNYRVTGTITVTNPNPIAVDFTVTDVLNDNTEAVVTCPGTGNNTGTVLANSFVTCTYTALPSGGTATLNTATVTETTPTGLAGGQDQKAVSFTPNVIGDESVTLADPRFGYSQLISGTTSPTFPETFPCPSDPTLYTNGTYTRTETNTATLTGDNTDLTRQAHVTITCRLEWADETATGFGTVYPNTSNWFMYTAYTTSSVRLVAGRDHQHAGDIFMSRSGSGPSTITTIRIVLRTGWQWADVGEVLKIQPFASRPTTYLEPGGFQYKFTAPNITNVPGSTVDFAADNRTVTVTIRDRSSFYGIHGDVERRLP
jgi:hypothetical protein